MKIKLVIKRIFVFTIILNGFSNVAIAASQTDNPFLPHLSDTQKLAKGFIGKPPYRNRAHIMRQRKVEKTELSALEISEQSDSSLAKAVHQKKFGHPQFSKRHGRRR